MIALFRDAVMAVLATLAGAAAEWVRRVELHRFARREQARTAGLGR